MDSERRVELPSQPSAAGAARSFVRDALGEHPVDAGVVHATQLIMSELVTNALLHGAGTLAATVALVGDVLRVVVEDDGEAQPLIRAASADATSGRGLAIVEAYARAWGVEDRGAGKAVWAELSLRDG